MSDQAIITVIFYIGSADKPVDKLKKSYVLKKYGHEWALRGLLDETAKELNYISGYGIWSIKAQSEELDFTVDYNHQFKPCQENKYLHFRDTLRLEVGRYAGWNGGVVRIEIPRVHLIEGDNLFAVRKAWVGSKKKVRRYGTIYHLSFERSDPILTSFQKKIKEGIFAPNVKKDWQPYEGYSNLSWWELPQTQTSHHRWDKENKREEVEERKRKKLEKAGIVYKDKKQKKKAHQVYIVQAKAENMPDVYKIGMSNAPGKRLQTLNTSNPYELKLLHKFVAEPAKEAEVKLHEMFKDNRLSGEWFRLTNEQVSGLKQIIGYTKGRFIREQEELPLELAWIKQIEEDGTLPQTIHYKGVDMMAIQGFGLGFTAGELTLDDILWLYEHNQNHKDVYAVTLAVNFSGNLLDFKSHKKFTATFKFNDWSPKTTECVDELLKRFNLGK